jgi:hypothetical protein
MATAAVLRSHDVLNNRMHLDAFTSSPTKPRRRRSPKPAGAASPPPKAAAVASSPPKASAVPKMPAPKAAAPSRRSPPPKPAARKQPSPTKEKRIVMEEVRILRRGEEPPAPAPVVAAAPAAVNKRVVRSTLRVGPKEPTSAPRKAVSAPDVAVYAGPAFASAPEPSSLPFPAFCLRRAETEATRGLRCLLGIGQVA